MKTTVVKEASKIADRETIAKYFGTGFETTDTILENLNYGFFAIHFGEMADAMWNEAHPYTYSNGITKDYFSFSIDFIEKHFELFSKNQFWTSAGWQYNDKTNRTEWTYKSGYTLV